MNQFKTTNNRPLITDGIYVWKVFISQDSQSETLTETETWIKQ